jgi:hypothetical protein
MVLVLGVKRHMIEERRGSPIGHSKAGYKVGTFNLPPQQLGLTYEISKFFNDTRQVPPISFSHFHSKVTKVINRWNVFHSEQLFFFRNIVFPRRNIFFQDLAFSTFDCIRTLRRVFNGKGRILPRWDLANKYLVCKSEGNLDFLFI